MEAKQAQLLDLLDGRKQFTIPIYQRTYSWQQKQCEQLFDDIIRIGGEESELYHFIGSVVYFKPDTSPITSVPKLLVIDGQQRLTTVSLLLLAITRFMQQNEQSQIIDETWEAIQETYLINKHKKDTSKYKLLLTKHDKETFVKLIDDIALSANDSKRIIENYNFFKGKIHAGNIQTIYHGIKKLSIVDVILERGKDNPQLIFESLNSTGLDLSQADLIRNYILMGQPHNEQSNLYEKYWYPIEQSFGDNIGSLAWFIRDYLTMKESSIPRIDLVYETYKNFMPSKNGFSSVVEAVKSLHHYSKYYVRTALLKEEDLLLLKKFKEIAKLKIDTSYPFILAVYSDYEDEVISKNEFIEILDIITNYVFRRAICGIPTNSLNKTFATLYKKVKRETYLESIKAAFILMDSYRRFPSDTEFNNDIQIKDVYNFRSRNYLLESLENWDRKETLNVENYTIEHILPQNPNTPTEWQHELGEKWEAVKEKYLHTFGNLTLTGYNSELSDNSFSEKKTIHGGFDNSPLFLNESVRKESKWNENAIQNRAATLAERALLVWNSPKLSDEILAIYREPEITNDETAYDLQHYEYLQGELLGLYKQLEKRVLNIDPSVHVECKKLYIAFKSVTNFVDVVPQKKRLRLSLNIDFDKIKDPKGLCKDVSNLGRWGNGDVEVGLERISDLDYTMELIEQAFEAQIE
ncbi:MAG: DUF262 and DUF1524 domain-containing protein [Bacteroidales bacterium]|jgi:uncharacterized protein with ParB-like and HNH nuclease domain/predicted transport protein|nr:DUF262 and DUF1524 domain-containing protein [Bacteroidales bacterium]